ncbi:MAG: 4Fe-4S dicluster domain-containing protein [Endomicrobia bacterium]|nr:4Fe-4S dicluster domain-containing protein [Endomicrobiia bacterium]
MKSLVVQPKKCVGCKVCELACSMYHYKTHKTTLAAIRVIKYDELSRDVPTVCSQCESAPCMKVCAVSALCRDLATNAVVIDYKKCIGCKLCVYTCPYGSISFDEELAVPVKCDLCKGEPQCVQFCPSSALEYKEVDSITTEIRHKVADQQLSSKE